MFKGSKYAWLTLRGERLAGKNDLHENLVRLDNMPNVAIRRRLPNESKLNRSPRLGHCRQNPETETHNRNQEPRFHPAT